MKSLLLAGVCVGLMCSPVLAFDAKAVCERYGQAVCVRVHELIEGSFDEGYMTNMGLAKLKGQLEDACRVGRMCPERDVLLEFLKGSDVGAVKPN